jgi:hypothetical protein
MGLSCRNRRRTAPSIGGTTEDSMYKHESRDPDFRFSHRKILNGCIRAVPNLLFWVTSRQIRSIERNQEPEATRNTRNHLSFLGAAMSKFPNLRRRIYKLLGWFRQCFVHASHVSFRSDNGARRAQRRMLTQNALLLLYLPFLRARYQFPDFKVWPCETIRTIGA